MRIDRNDIRVHSYSLANSLCERALVSDPTIRQVLNEREDHAAPRARFEFELENHLNASDGEKTLRTAIGWGRYAELFAYDDATRGFRLVDAAH